MRRLRAIVRPEEALLLLFLLAFAAVTVATRAFYFTAFRHPRFLQCVAVLAVAVAARALHRERAAPPGLALARAARSAAGVARDFAPFFGILILYETLHDLTPILRPDVVDGRLAAIDRAMFGVDVAWWLGQHATPLLTRAMVLCYASYFIAPPLLAAAIYWTGNRPLCRAFMLSGVLTSLVGYLGYLAVPAVGPYVYQASLFPTRLPGGGPETHLFIQAIDDLKGVARDCFPSLHTAHTTVALFYAARFHRLAFAVYLPIALGLYLSTLYLRMHYVVDVAAGLATAALTIWLGPRLERAWRPSEAAAGDA
jgi:membrane-associated phospholipid phosphatase